VVVVVVVVAAVLVVVVVVTVVVVAAAVVVVVVVVVVKKESRNRPGVAQRVPAGLGSQISRHSAREGGEVVSLTQRPPLPPGMFLVRIFTRV
jgi:hypothetical protein